MKVCVGAIDHHTLQVEAPTEVADLIRQALKVIPAERLVLSSDCGMGREGMSRRHAFYKMVALVQGTNIVRKELGLPVAESLGADPKFSLIRRRVVTKRSAGRAGLAPDPPEGHGVIGAIVGMGWWGQTLVESVQRTATSSASSPARRGRSRPRSRRSPRRRSSRWPRTSRPLLANKDVDAVVLATPHSQHVEQVIAAAQAGKHVFCEKPFALTQGGRRAAVAATKKAGVTLGLGYNRRFHPEMTALRDKIKAGDLGTVLHFEATMTFPNALLLKPEAWRADREETPCGGLTPMGVHAIDGMIDLGGEIDQVYCQSFRRVVQVDSDDTTSMLFRMKDGMSGYLGTMTATGPGFSFQVYRLERVGAARRHDARRRRLVRGTPHAPVRHRASSSRSRGRPRRGRPRGSTSPARRSRRSPRGLAAAAVSDSDQRDGPRRGRHRGGGAIRATGTSEKV